MELVGIQVETADTKIDRTTKEAVTQMKTNTILTTVAGNKHSIGYASTGTLNDTVKAVQVDGIAATTENIKNNKYKLARSFIIVTQPELDEVAKDFIDFMLSKDGQDIVAQAYTSVADDMPPYTGEKPSGKIVVAGSSSVTPIMEKLSEAYLAVNPNAIIEIQQSDSSSGIRAVMNGTATIGMTSRDLNDTEKMVLVETAIALDGIAVIVHPSNPIANLSTADVKAIFIGEIVVWDKVSELSGE